MYLFQLHRYCNTGRIGLAKTGFLVFNVCLKLFNSLSNQCYTIALTTFYVSVLVCPKKNNCAICLSFQIWVLIKSVKGEIIFYFFSTVKCLRTAHVAEAVSTHLKMFEKGKRKFDISGIKFEDNFKYRIRRKYEPGWSEMEKQ